MVDALVDQVADRIQEMQRRFPVTPYAGRLYFCAACESIDGVVAPPDDLILGYPCPECGRPQLALTEPGVPRSGDRPAA